MAYDLGDTVALSATIRDADGSASNATTITLTITLPDGTTATPSVTNPPAATGVYEYDYATTQAGRHVVRWVAGTPDDAYVDVFYVRPADPFSLVSLADVKKHLNITVSVTAHDDELRDAIEVASEIAESYSSFRRRTVVETHSGRGAPGIALLEPPVLSITSVTESGTTVDADGYSLSGDAGVLYRVSGYCDSAWRSGRNNIVITYVPGRSLIPPSVLDSVKELVRINFRPQIGGNYSPFDPPAASDQGPGEVRLGFFVPRRIAAVFERHSVGGGFA